MRSAPLILSTVQSRSITPNCDQHKNGCSEKSFRKERVRSRDLIRHNVAVDLAWVGKALGRAFPEAQSENELCELAAQVLSTAHYTVTPRTVKNWVRGDNTPHFRYIRSILVLAGAEAVFNLIDAEQA